MFLDSWLILSLVPRIVHVTNTLDLLRISQKVKNSSTVQHFEEKEQNNDRSSEGVITEFLALSFRVIEPNIPGST